MTHSSTNIHVREAGAVRVLIRQWEKGMANSRVTVDVSMPGGSVTFFIPMPADGSMTTYELVDQIRESLASPTIEIISD